VLKNSINCASRPYGKSAWTGKPVAMMGTSTGFFGTARARYHLRQCFVSLDMPGINRPEVMIGNARKAFDGQGKLAGAASLALNRERPGKLVRWTRQMKKLIIAMTI